MTTKKVNELEPELLGIHSLNSLAYTNSPSRGFMFASHFTQHLVTNGLQEKIIYSGVEQELAKYTLGVRMPANGRIIDVIDKYPMGIGSGSLKLNPETLIIFDNEETGEIDCLSIPTYRTFHQYFGWSCVPKEGMELLRRREFVPKGTVFVDTPGIKDGNSYMYGRNVNVAYMAIPGVSEDGIVVSQSCLENWKFKVYETRVVEWGSNSAPINLYGHNKPFPDIGEYVREDGLLMALRNYESDTFAVDMGINSLRKVDYVFDKQTYVNMGKGRVVDLEIIANNNPIKNIPLGMSEQPDKYVQAYIKYNQAILQTEQRIKAERKAKYGNNKLNISPAFNEILVRAMVITNYHAEKTRLSLKLLYRKDPIDEYYAKFVVEYEMTPNIGDKFSNSSGSKGVICKIMKDEDMPIRPDGVRAEMIIDPGPVFHRMNIGQSFEQHITCTAHDVTAQLIQRLGLINSTHINDFNNRPTVTPNVISKINKEVFNETYNFLLSFYKVFNDIMYDKFANLNMEEKIEHICDIVNEGTCYIFLPVNNTKLPDEIIHELETKFKPTYTTVKYVGASGKQVETAKKIRIGKVYMFLLDKLAKEWSATSLARLQHFGIVSAVTRSEKFAYPYRNSPTRVSGETESRIFACYTGQEAIAEMFDRTNNPITRRNICWNILTADKPGNIERIIDRNVVPLGASRPIQIVNHIFMCAGFKPTYLPEVIESIRQGIENQDNDND